ncbi:carboxypeptidase-like regulatory domain-containing protein [Capnocytophaga bilenii]
MKLTTLSLFFFTLTAFAQSKIVSNNGTPIEYVNIGIVGTHKGVISDEHGNFFLEKLAAKPTDSIYFSHISYKYKSLLAKDIKNDVVLEDANIVLPETTLKIKTPKIHTLKGKGIPTIVTIISDKEELEKGDLKSEVGDFITLKKDTQFTEFSITINKNTFNKSILRIVIYQVDKERKNFIPLLEEPIYINIPYSKKKQTITKKLSTLALRGNVYIGVQFVAFEGDKKATIEFNAKASGGWKRQGNEVEKLPFGLGFPFSVKGYEYEVVE